jgi:hypothetical protein
MWGEIFGVGMWLWFFYRARLDSAIVLGLRHPWEHDHGEHDHGHDAAVSLEEMQEGWDKFTAEATIQNDDEEEEDDD